MPETTAKTPAPPVTLSQKANRQHVGRGDLRTWWQLDAKHRPLGRVASAAAKLLIGKHKPSYVPYIDQGDEVIIVNAADLVLTGRKAEQKQYARHSGYPGGLKIFSAADKIRAGKQDEMFRHAVRGMLPQNKLGDLMIQRLHVYLGAEHPHTQQEVKMVASDSAATIEKSVE